MASGDSAGVGPKCSGGLEGKEGILAPVSLGPAETWVLLREMLCRGKL